MRGVRIVTSSCLLHLEYPFLLPFNMSAAGVKLSPAIKQLIALPRARGGSIPSPGQNVLNDLFSGIAKRGEQGGIKKETWLTLMTAGVMTVNSPQSLCGLYDFASGTDGTEGKVRVAAVSSGRNEVYRKKLRGRLCEKLD